MDTCPDRPNEGEEGARFMRRDVHQKTMVLVTRTTAEDRSIQREQHTFSMMTADLLVLTDWCCHPQRVAIAIGSTGVYR
jgi:hypothetical protein